MAAPVTNESGATSRGAWMALIAALLGWLFDGAEMGVFSMVGRDAIRDMLDHATSADPAVVKMQDEQVGFYFGIIIAVFLVGAATGGVLFGWLGDRVGRVRAMSLSVFTYAVFTGLCGLAQNPVQLGILRFIASLGMGGEWALGVALVMEVWPNKSRAFMAGLIGAAANVGYGLVGVIGIALNSILHQADVILSSVGLSESMIAMLTAHKGWRLMMLLGTLPALLTFFFRLFVPESHKWEEERGKGSLSHWATIDLLGVLVGALGPALIIYVWAVQSTPASLRIAGTALGLLVALVGYTFPVYRYLTRALSADITGTASPVTPIIRRMMLGACLGGVALLGTWGSTQWSAAWAGQLTEGRTDVTNPREWTQIFSAGGAIIGTILAALSADWFGRRAAYCLLCALSLMSAVYFYQFHNQYDTSFLAAALILGACTASFYGWLPLYLPELFPTKVRATGQGFAFNFGRILAAIGTLQMSALFPYFASMKTYAGLQGGIPVACSFISGIYLLGMVLIWFAPETKGKSLPE